MNTEQARFNMVEQQIRTWDVLDDHVLNIIQSTPREEFVPAQYRSLAFADLEIPLGHQQVMMAPKIEGRMLQALQIMPEDNVLEVGTGSGFVTSCLAKMSASVTSIELHQEFSAQAQKHTQAKDISNIDFIVADIFQYLDNLKNYDVIAVTGSSPKELSQLSAHLLPGGRMFSIIGKEPVMTAILTTCISDNSYRHEKLFETSLPALIMPPGEKEFLF